MSSLSSYEHDSLSYCPYILDLPPKKKKKKKKKKINERRKRKGEKENKPTFIGSSVSLTASLTSQGHKLRDHVFICRSEASVRSKSLSEPCCRFEVPASHVGRRTRGTSDLLAPQILSGLDGPDGLDVMCVEASGALDRELDGNGPPFPVRRVVGEQCVVDGRTPLRDVDHEGEEPPLVEERRVVFLEEFRQQHPQRVQEDKIVLATVRHSPHEHAYTRVEGLANHYRRRRPISTLGRRP